MTTSPSNPLADIFLQHQADLLDEWLRAQTAALTARRDLISEPDLRRQSAEFIALLLPALRAGPFTALSAPVWKPVGEFLGSLSRSRTTLGFSPSETATFVFSLKEPLFVRLQQEFRDDIAGLGANLWTATTLFDALGLHTIETFLRAREEIISRQQLEMLELSTPVVRVWEGIVAVPLIGTLDSARTQVVMENLLNSIVATESSIAIVDITGVPAVDTLVAQHLLKTIAAAKLMGAQCIISGIRPQIAQTMVHLGVAFEGVITKATLADALAHAFRQIGYVVRRLAPTA